jgi:hypothetical protein
MFETFALRLAAGMLLALFVLPPRVVHPRFYRIHFIIFLGLLAGAMGIAWDAPHTDGFWLAVGLATGAGLVGSLTWSPESLSVGFTCIGVAAGAALTAISFTITAQPFWLALVTEILSALVLGLALTAMLMGHWYLIAPTMSLQPLLRLLYALFVAVGLRAVPAACDFVTLWQVRSSFETLEWLWLAVRWGAGIVGLFALTWMSWQATRIRATQSATGILYVVTIFAFMGELTDLLLRVATY